MQSHIKLCYLSLVQVNRSVFLLSISYTLQICCTTKPTAQSILYSILKHSYWKVIPSSSTPTQSPFKEHKWS